MTNWVTIKIPESIRDDAREDDRTYGEIMQAGLGSNDSSNAGGDPIDIDALVEQIADRVESEGGVGPDQIAREISRQLDYGQIAGQVADEVEARLR